MPSLPDRPDKNTRKTEPRREPEHEIVRGRPGRRTGAERAEAVLALLSGKASVDEVARRYGVLASTVEGWRQAAIEAVGAAMRQGSGKTAHELELEKECKQLRAVVSDLSISKALMERALKEFPSRPARSRR